MMTTDCKLIIIPLIIPNNSFYDSFNDSFNDSLSNLQQACQFLVIIWCIFHVLNCACGVQAR